MPIDLAIIQQMFGGEFNSATHALRLSWRHRVWVLENGYISAWGADLPSHCMRQWFCDSTLQAAGVLAHIRDTLEVTNEI